MEVEDKKLKSWVKYFQNDGKGQNLKWKVPNAISQLFHWLKIANFKLVSEEAVWVLDFKIVAHHSDSIGFYWCV